MSVVGSEVAGQEPGGSSFIIHVVVSPPDHTEAPPPPDKMAPPPQLLLQEQIGSEACQSKPLSGLMEVPPPSQVYAGGSRPRLSPEPTGGLPLLGHVTGRKFLSSSVWFCVSGVTMTTFLFLILVVFILAALNSG